MNHELFAKLVSRCNETLEAGLFGTNNYFGENSTSHDFGTDDDICLPSGKYFYAYTDQTEGLPMPMMCLPLCEEMYKEGFVDCHQVLIWKLDSFDDPFAPSPEGTIDNTFEEPCPGESVVLAGLHH